MSASSKAAQGRPELQIETDLLYQRRVWRAQRIGWIVFVALLVAASLGVFGAGPLSTTVAGSKADGLWVEYERVARALAPSTLVIHVDRRAGTADPVPVMLGGDYVRAAKIESLTPPVASGASTPDGAVLRFEAPGDAGALQFVVHLKFSRPGLARGQIAVPGRAPLEISHWVHP
jgi:hypothetical protein